MHPRVRGEQKRSTSHLPDAESTWPPEVSTGSRNHLQGRDGDRAIAAITSRSSCAGRGDFWAFSSRPSSSADFASLSAKNCRCFDSSEPTLRCGDRGEPKSPYVRKVVVAM